MSNPIKFETYGNVLVIRFDHPEKRNALSAGIVELLSVGLFGIDEAVEKVVLTGTGDIFAAGADLREISQLTAETAPEFARRGQGLMNQIEDLPQMTVAAITGACYGGALDLALACDRRIASPNATFCHPGTGLGIITGWGGTQRLPRLIGLANAFEMFFTALPVTAEQALKIGLVDEIAENVVGRAFEVV